MPPNSCRDSRRSSGAEGQTEGCGGWFGASSYGSEFPRIPFEAFLPTLRDADFQFVEEEPLPIGYRPGDIVL